MSSESENNYLAVVGEDDIVISGISGVFPNSDNLRSFGYSLLNKEDLVTDDDRRWRTSNKKFQRSGKINELNKFDEAFFGISPNLADNMDPMGRLMLEKAFEAIIDAGCNPKEFSGTNAAVIVGVCFADAESTTLQGKRPPNPYTVSGTMRALLANRISNWLNVSGPSYVVDTACSSSFYALEHAYQAIRRGDCEAAIVSASNVCIQPLTTESFSKVGALSVDGKCRSFDETANGYVRSEAAVTVVLQKRKDAKRMYARIVHTKTNSDGYKEEGVHAPSTEKQAQLMRLMYEECSVNPCDVKVIEAHGTGTKVGDPAELRAIESIFIKNCAREEPLLVTCVKSNMGHAEGASGLCSIAKVILSYEMNVILPTIHFKTPRSDIDSLRNGQMKVVTEPTMWNGGLVSINNFGFGGANAHVLLDSNPKQKQNEGLPSDDLPRLVFASGRTWDAVNVILEDITSRPIDNEYVALLHEIYKDNISGHLYRGYAILEKQNSTPTKSINKFRNDERPVWFVFAGMGSQWPGMGKKLMELQAFSDSIRKCHDVLKPFGLNLIEIITKNDERIFDDIVNTFVGIVAIEIALIDLLKKMGIRYDGLVGHSVGEFGCAYADDCLDAKQTILLAYFRGKAVKETLSTRGSMAAINTSHTDVRKYLPCELDIACHNGPTNCTISGPREIVREFVETMKAKDVLASEINSSNIALHSRHIKDAMPKFIEYTKNIIDRPLKRSEKWISSTFLKGYENEEVSKYCSIDYIVANISGTVHFEEACRSIPENAVVIEVSPHGLFQSILRQCLHKNAISVPLTSRKNRDNMLYFLNALGKLFEVGLTPKVSNLYPAVEFPVSKGTPMISPLIRWNHGNEYYVYRSDDNGDVKNGIRTMKISLNDEEYAYLSGHVVQGSIVVPATFYLQIVWETLGLELGIPYDELSVVFRHVKLIRKLEVNNKEPIELIVVINSENNDCFVKERGSLVMTGKIFPMKDGDWLEHEVPIAVVDDEHDPEHVPMDQEDIYMTLKMSKLNYKDPFKPVVRADYHGATADVTWSGNFVTFIDGLLQAFLVCATDINDRSILPVSIEELVINCSKHKEEVESLKTNGKNELTAYVNKNLKSVRCGGVEFRKVDCKYADRAIRSREPYEEGIQFIPYVFAEPIDFPNGIYILTQIIADHLETEWNVLELVDRSRTYSSDLVIASTMARAVIFMDFELKQLVESSENTIAELKNNNCSIVCVEPSHTRNTDIDENDHNCDDVRYMMNHEASKNRDSNNLVITTNILRHHEALESCINGICDGGFILSRESNYVENGIRSYNLEIYSRFTIDKDTIVLLRKIVPCKKEIICTKITNDPSPWLSDLKKNLQLIENDEDQKLVIYAEKEPTSGILGLYNCIRRENAARNLCCFFIADNSAPDFSPTDPFYAMQMAKNMKMNVFKNGTWGNYEVVSLELEQEKPSTHAFYNLMTQGDLNSLRWIEGPLDPNVYKPSSDRALIHVYYSALNFRDIMLCTNRISAEIIPRDPLEEDCVIGFEFAGKTENGDRYMGFGPAKAISNLMEVDKGMIWPVPSHWSMEEAATVPVVYFTVLHALFACGRIQKGDSILIHSGAGAVGLAAINVCIKIGCEIFVTVGTHEKEELIKKHYPQIPQNHIGTSRNCSFLKMIMEVTRGKGVDVVLNSLAGEKLEATIDCLSDRGRFLEFGKYDFAKNNPLGMKCFLRGISFFGIDLMLLVHDKNNYSMMQKAIDDDLIKPLPRSVFSIEKTKDAFSYMMSGKHVGKVLIQIRDEESFQQAKPTVKLINAMPRYMCLRWKSYVICGGLGGVGLEFAKLLAHRGARNIILSSTRGVTNGYQARNLKIYRSRGVNMVVVKGDVSNERDVEKLLQIANSFGPVSGIFNLAGVLRQKYFTSLTEDDFVACALPKLHGTLNLDKISRKLCPELKQFVVFSSTSVRLECYGLSSYSMYNSSLDRICELRKSENLPALSIQWGPIADVGMAVATVNNAMRYTKDSEFAIGIAGFQELKSMAESFDHFYSQSKEVVRSFVRIEDKFSADARAEGSSISDSVAYALGLLDKNAIDERASLGDLGLESVTASVIKEILQKDYRINMPASDIRKLTFAKLYEIEGRSEKDASRSTDSDVHELFLKNFIATALEADLDFDEEIVELPLKLDNHGESNIPAADYPIVFALPALSGFTQPFEPLNEELRNIRMFGFKYRYRNPRKSVAEMADAFWPHILEKISGQQKFYVIGHSFAISIIFELLKRVEQERKVGIVWLLDATPEIDTEIMNHPDVKQAHEYLRKTLYSYAVEKLQPDLDPSVLSPLLERVDDHTYLEYLRNAPLDEKLKTVLSVLYSRSKLLTEYEFTGNFNTQASLIRIARNHASVPDDYSLSQYFKNPVRVHRVEGNHFSLVAHKETAAIIQRELEADLLAYAVEKVAPRVS